ncbi:MAG: hypothetical protein GY875_23875 [Gammaproteobacteria bacterium]|nr:hypothetical protein [Gammaproteobacteria bacterium]
MTLLKPELIRLFAGLITLAILCALPSAKLLAANIADDVAFPEKFMFRVANYQIDSADTKITVFNNQGLGAGYSFSRDLGGDDSATVPRIDMYYRFNERHRIEFSTFSMDRDGTKILELEVDIEDQTFSIGEQLTSDISYELYRLGYSYSFFHSDRVELAVSVGLNITKYEFDFENEDGTKTSKSDATAPLPMFGLRVGYAINSDWSVHYLAESFFIEIEDTFKGSLLNNEVNLQYRFLDNFLVGGGITHVGTDLNASDSDWKGGVNDSYSGYLLFAGFYF